MPGRLIQFQVVGVGLEHSRRGHGIRLPSELPVTDSAHDERENDGEGNPRDCNPGHGHRFVEHPDHETGGGPAICGTAEVGMDLIRHADPVGDPIRTSHHGQGR